MPKTVVGPAQRQRNNRPTVQFKKSFSRMSILAGGIDYLV
jgi:hypothetical protein